jgi:hypothetical protein
MLSGVSLFNEVVRLHCDNTLIWIVPFNFARPKHGLGGRLRLLGVLALTVQGRPQDAVSGVKFVSANQLNRLSNTGDIGFSIISLKRSVYKAFGVIQSCISALSGGEGSGSKTERRIAR